MDDIQNIPQMMADMGKRAKAAAADLGLASTEAKNKALVVAAKALIKNTKTILEANEQDLEYGREKGLSDAMMDRLALDRSRVRAIAKGLEDIAALPDPVGNTIAEWDRPNGLKIARVRVPLGVIGVIYESRPNVTADAGALCLKAGNAVILRGGSDSLHSSSAIHACLKEGLEAAGLPTDAVQLVTTRDRAAVGEMLTMTNYIDIIVPRGGRSLVERVQTESRVPVFAHLEGICHVYIDKDADPQKALDVTVNAKMRRTGICGAAETLLVERDAEAMAIFVIGALLDAGCEVRGDEAMMSLDDRVKPASDEDWKTEYLDAIISARFVDGVEGAIKHIAENSSGHTESIITENHNTAETFLRKVDSAIVMHNASTQFADGGEFGMGAEIGIATGRIHARGPVGLEQLTSFKYQVRGTGQTRP